MAVVLPDASSQSLYKSNNHQVLGKLPTPMLLIGSKITSKYIPAVWYDLDITGSKMETGFLLYISPGVPQWSMCEVACQDCDYTVNGGDRE